MGTQSYCVQLVIVVFCVFSLLILGRMKDEFADFELEPKMREEERRRGKHDCSLPLAAIYSKEVPEQQNNLMTM